MSDYRLLVKFETAWNPPYPVLEKLVELGFEVRHAYHDEGDDEFHVGYQKIEEDAA